MHQANGSVQPWRHFIATWGEVGAHVVARSREGESGFLSGSLTLKPVSGPPDLDACSSEGEAGCPAPAGSCGLAPFVYWEYLRDGKARVTAPGGPQLGSGCVLLERLEDRFLLSRGCVTSEKCSEPSTAGCVHAMEVTPPTPGGREE